jgi:hypothetical protein
LLTLELAHDQRAAGIQQVVDLVVRGAVEDARPVAAGLDEPDATQRGEVLRRRPGLEPELDLERAHRALAFAQQLDDPHTGGMPEDAEQACLHLVDGTHAVRHARSLPKSQ